MLFRLPEMVYIPKGWSRKGLAFTISYTVLLEMVRWTGARFSKIMKPRVR